MDDFEHEDDVENEAGPTSAAMVQAPAMATQGSGDPFNPLQ
jgi:hypothetical protein